MIKFPLKSKYKGGESMSLIEVKDIYKIYNPGENEVRALDGVSLTIDRGEFVAIIYDEFT